jgi:ABC-type multidrug transport system fused ATPase/permease subunit
MKNLRIIFRLLKYVLRYRGRLLLLIPVALFGVLLEISKPLPLKVIFDYVLANQPLPSFWANFLPDFSRSDLLFWSVTIGVLIVVGTALIGLFVTNFTISLAQKLVYDFSLDLFAKLQKLSLTYHGRSKVGDITQRLNQDVFVVYFVVAQIALPFLTSTICLIGMFFIMMQLDVTLALIALTVIPLLITSLVIFANPMTKTTQNQYGTQGELTAFISQSLTSIKAIQGFAREEYIYDKLKKKAADFGQAYKVANRVSTGFNQVTTLITGLAAAILLGLGANKALYGTLSNGDLLVFLGYIGALYGPVNSLATAIGATLVLGARSRRVFEILDSTEVIPEKNPAILLENSRGAISFENVLFGYGQGENESRLILKNVSFEVHPGQIVAIVGATGVGKTSLVSLLCRFYDVWAGRILIDGIDVRDYSLKSLRENVSLVLQEPFLFPMSIAENIAFGRPDAAREEIIEVAKIAQAHDFIENLPDGYDTVITERGNSLSGGEKQRIAIARALLKDAPILILDEPTSALDANTESKIFKAMTKLMEGRTTFVISHRLSTIRRADQIITLKDGKIVETGTHESLLAAENVYADLYRHQHIAAM